MNEIGNQKKMKGVLMKHSIKSKKRNQQIADIVSLILVILLAALVMLPLWWMVRSSLMKSLEIFKWPPQFLPSEWLFSNYNIKPTTFDFLRLCFCAAAL
jgi:multiple sugar transport system permease protein